MNISRFYPMFVIFLLLAGRNLEAQCTVSLSADVVNVSCFGGSNGAIDLTITGGFAPYLVEWSNGIQVEDIFDLSEGNYVVTVTDQLGCTATLGETVMQPAVLSATATGGNINCIQSGVTVIAQATGGTAPFLYLWSSGETGLSIWKNLIGNYTITVIDGNSCTTTASGVVGIDTVHGMADAGKDVSLNCQTPFVTLGGNGTSTGPEYFLHWTGPGMTSGANGNDTYLFPRVTKPGIYNLEVFNQNNGCSTYDQVIVSGEGPPVANAGLDKGLSCGGGGQVTLDGSGSSQGIRYTYNWGTIDGNIAAGSHTLSPTVDQAGTYVLNVVDSQTGCVSTSSVRVFPGPVISPQEYSVTDVSCSGQPGHANLGMVMGIPPYSYQWSNGALTPGTGSVPEGIYTVTVTDATGCNYYAAIEVPQDENPWIELIAQATQTDCQGGNNGAINLEDGGNSGFSLFYAWANGATTQDLNNLGTGTYTVTVSDMLSCSSTLSVEVVSSGMTLSTQVIPANTCVGAHGTIDLTVAGGTAPYTYIWSDGETAEDAHPQVIGSFIVTVVDAVGCTTSISATLGDTPPLLISLTVWPDECGANGGGISPTVSGGLVQYAFQWSTGSALPDLLNLTAGTYTVTVTDDVGCTQSASGTIIQTSGITIDVLTTNASCNGSDGAIDITVTGGFNYDYTWSNGQTFQDMVNLPAGTYTVTVTTSANCTETANVTITPNGLTVNAQITADSACVIPTGAIDLTVAASGSETYLWSNAATTQDLTGLTSGNYSVTITGNAGCTATFSYQVPFSPKIPVLSIVAIPTICDLANGSIDVSVGSGVAPYTFQWSNGATMEDLSSVVAGVYDLTVTGANGCTSTLTQDVPNNGLSFTIDGAITPASFCSPAPDGSITITVQPLGNYSFSWSDGSITQNRSGLTAGTYSITVSAGGSCTQEASFDVPLDLNAPTINANLFHILCFGNNDGAIELLVSGGTLPYAYQWSSNLPPVPNPGNLPAGTYSVTVTDAKGCTDTALEIITEPTPLICSIVSLSNDCSSETITGPNLPNLSYEWNGPSGFTSTDAAITISLNGNYSLTITDQNGCTATNFYSVNLSGNGPCGVLKGRIFHDKDESCSLDFNEPGLAGWIVRAEGANDTLYGTTNAQGRYWVGVPVGTYTMKVLIPNGLWQVCPGGTPVTLGIAGDTIAAGDFAVQGIYHCPALQVSMGTSKLRRCFLDNYYHVEYCNMGTEAAQDAYVTVILDPALTAMSASIPYVEAGFNALHFEVGDLAVGECGMFDIQVYVSCNAVIGQTHCSEVTIYPDTLCAPVNSNWTGASLAVSSRCSSDSLRFTIKNTGKGLMSSSSNYIVVEDGVMFRQGILQPLMEQDSMLLAVPANGSTWRVEVEQAAYHPYPSPIGLSVEGCTQSALFSTGFVNQFTTPDESPSVDIDCTSNKGSFDPNDKYGYPVGYGADHYIRPGTDIEYLIRFQNTGSDTAFTVRIIDTLSSWLDPATIRFGASTHPYKFDLEGEGIVHFIFENIQLPDSNTNEAASHGFAQFSIKPRADAPLESVIENTAAIYFDYNAPVLTNTTFHRLGENFVTVGLWQPLIPEASVTAVPNPFDQETRLEVKGLMHYEQLRLEVFDLHGKLMSEMYTDGAFFQLKKGDWPSGIYVFKISQGTRLIGSGKLIAE